MIRGTGVVLELLNDGPAGVGLLVKDENLVIGPGGLEESTHHRLDSVVVPVDDEHLRVRSRRLSEARTTPSGWLRSVRDSGEVEPLTKRLELVDATRQQRPGVFELLSD